MKKLTARVLEVTTPDHFQGYAESQNLLVLCTSVTSLSTAENVLSELLTDFFSRTNDDGFTGLSSDDIANTIDAALMAYASDNASDVPMLPTLDDGLQWPEDPADVNWFHTRNMPLGTLEEDRGFYFTGSSGHEIDSFSGPYDTWGQMVRAAAEAENWTGYEDTPVLYLMLESEEVETELVSRDYLIMLIADSIAFRNDPCRVPQILRHGHKGFLYCTDAELNEVAAGEGLSQRVATDADD